MILFDRTTEIGGSVTPEEIFLEIDDILSIDKDGYQPRIASLLASIYWDSDLLGWWVGRVQKSGEIPLLTGAQSFMIHRSKEMYVRLNLWFPKPSDLSLTDSMQKYLTIDQCHNHDFSFYSICLFGPGYETSFFRHSGPRLSYANDVLNLSPIGRFHLTTGRVIYIERDFDFHTQHWVDEFSITLNVIPTNQPSGLQFIIDEETMKAKYVMNNIKSKSHYDMIYGQNPQ